MRTCSLPHLDPLGLHRLEDLNSNGLGGGHASGLTPGQSVSGFSLATDSYPPTAFQGECNNSARQLMRTGLRGSSMKSPASVMVRQRRTRGYVRNKEDLLYCQCVLCVLMGINGLPCRNCAPFGPQRG